MRRPAVTRLGRWLPGLVLFETSVSATCLAEDERTGKAALLTYLTESPSPDKIHSQFCRNARHMINAGLRAKCYRAEMAGQEPAPILVQKYRDHLSLHKFFQRITNSGNNVPGPILAGLIITIASRAMRRIRNRIRFELQPESIFIESSGRIGIYSALPCELHKLFGYQLPGILAAIFAPHAGQIDHMSRELEFFLKYPNRDSLKSLRSGIASKRELTKWVESIFTKDSDPEMEYRKIQWISSDSSRPVAPAHQEFVEMKPSAKKTATEVVTTNGMTTRLQANPTRNRQAGTSAATGMGIKVSFWSSVLTRISLRGYITTAFFFIVLTLLAAFFSSDVRETESRIPFIKNSAPIVIQAPAALYFKEGDFVATVLIHVDENGAVRSFSFQNATPEQRMLYGSSVKLIRFRPGFSGGKPSEAFKLVQIPLRRKG